MWLIYCRHPSAVRIGWVHKSRLCAQPSLANSLAIHNRRDAAPISVGDQPVIAPLIPVTAIALPNLLSGLLGCQQGDRKINLNSLKKSKFSRGF